MDVRMHCLISQSKPRKEDCRGGVCIGFHNGFVVCKNLVIDITSSGCGT